jgi:hypothetical protein
MVLLLHSTQVLAKRKSSSDLIGQNASSTSALGQPLAIYGSMACEMFVGKIYASSNFWVICLRWFQKNLHVLPCFRHPWGGVREAGLPPVGAPVIASSIATPMQQSMTDC